MTLKIGILGYGGAGIAHYFYYSRIPGCEVTKIFDIKQEGQDRAKATCSEVYGSSDLKKFWQNLDAVSICTPDSTHADYIVEALSQGLHVLCEKPLTHSVEGIRKIKLAAQKSDQIVAILQQMRFVPLHQKIKALLEKGRLGTISYLEGYYVHNLIERAFRFDNWREEGEATPLIYAGCHFVDLMRWFANDEIEEIHAFSNHLAFPKYPEADLTAATFRFQKGALGKVLVTFGSACPQDHSVRIYGNEGCVDNNILFDRDGKRTILHSPLLIQKELLNRKSAAHYGLDLYRQFRQNIPHYLAAKSFEWLNPLLGRARDGEYYTRFYPLRLYEHQLACLYAVQDFIDAVRNSRQPKCTVEDTAKTVLACIAGVESSRTGKPIRVKKLDEII